MGIVGKIASPIISLSVIAWDNVIAVANLVTPKLKADAVVPEGAPGYHGAWPEFVPPGEGDSRSACPMLNAMANHGILRESAVQFLGRGRYSLLILCIGQHTMAKTSPSKTSTPKSARPSTSPHPFASSSPNSLPISSSDRTGMINSTWRI